MIAALIRAKLARLLPLLGSDSDGEALGAARAISRVLVAAGADCHDLARLIEAEPAVATVHSWPSSSTWQPKPRKARM